MNQRIILETSLPYSVQVGPINASGTCFQGEVRATYDQLVQALGPPTYPNGDDDKVDREWTMTFTSVLDPEITEVATLYNWKDGPNYLGADGLPPEAILDWHVGGVQPLAVRLVEALLHG